MKHNIYSIVPLFDQKSHFLGEFVPIFAIMMLTPMDLIANNNAPQFAINMCCRH